MNDTTWHKSLKVEIFDFENDFKILTLKEKHVVLKNAKSLLRLQKENEVLHHGTPISQMAEA